VGECGDRVLFRARMACAGLRWRWVADLSLGGGDVRVCGGDFCAGAVVFDPNMLANGAMVTTDVGAACCLWRDV